MVYLPYTTSGMHYIPDTVYHIIDTRYHLGPMWCFGLLPPGTGWAQQVAAQVRLRSSLLRSSARPCVAGAKYRSENARRSKIRGVQAQLSLAAKDPGFCGSWLLWILVSYGSHCPCWGEG